MRKKTWKVAAAVVLTGSVLQVGCLTQRQMNEFTNDIFGAITAGLVTTISNFDFASLIPGA